MANNSSGFLTGFTLGMIAGACGFYLYGTKEGTKVRGQIRAEFQRAYDAIPESEKSAYPDSLRGSLRHFVNSVFLDLPKTETQPAQKGAHKSQSKAMSTDGAAPKSTKFKNTK